MQKLTQIFIVFGIVLQFTTSYSAPLCEIDEHWQPVLETCLPCQPICDPVTKTDCQRYCWRYIISLISKRASTEASTSSTSKQVTHTSNPLSTPANEASGPTNSHTSTGTVPHPKVPARAGKDFTLMITFGVVISLSALAALVYCFRHKICSSAKALFERNRPTVRAQEEEGTQEETIALREL